MEVTLTSRQISVQTVVPDSAVGTAAAPPPDGALQRALNAPLELPPVNQCVVPGDRVVIVADPEAPQVVDAITEVHHRLCSVPELSISILLPPEFGQPHLTHLAQEIGQALENAVPVEVYDAEDEQQRSYLASSAAGERIYLARQLVDADLVITISAAQPDPLVGTTGATALLYPRFSEPAIIADFRGRELRAWQNAVTGHAAESASELIEEIGWLLGVQFSVSIVCGPDGKLENVFCGRADAAVRAAAEYLQRTRPAIAEEATTDLVVMDVAAVNEVCSWRQFARAVTVGATLTGYHGRVVVVCDLEAPDGTAMTALSRTENPEDLEQPLMLEPPPDAFEALQLIRCCRDVRILLRSSLPDAFVEELGMIPISDADEVQRLIDHAESPRVLRSASGTCCWPA